MAPIDLCTAIGRLLIDPRLRQDFHQDPAATADRIHVVESDRPAFVSLDSNELDAQAHTLIKKRFHEVRLLLRETLKKLDQNGTHLFFTYAGTAWPKGHKRHYEDAVTFCDYLRKHDLPINQREYNRVWFNCGNKHLALHYVRNQIIAGKSRRGLQVIYRGKARPREVVFYLAV